MLTILTVSDISERMQVNEELRQNEQRYRSLVLATSQIVWNTTDEGGFATEQPDWGAFTGQTFDELKNFGWLNAIHPEDQHYTEQVWLKAIANRTLYEWNTASGATTGNTETLLCVEYPCKNPTAASASGLASVLI
jgi:PAS domain-containing protein